MDKISPDNAKDMEKIEKPNHGEFLIGLTGQTRFVYDGYIYSKKVCSKQSIRWRCINNAKLKCRGRLTTPREYPYSSVTNFRPHSHPPQEMTKEVTELRMKLREEAMARTGKPAEIMEKVLEGIPDEVQKSLGNLSSIKRDLRYFRSQKDTERKSRFLEKITQLKKALPIETSGGKQCPETSGVKQCPETSGVRQCPETSGVRQCPENSGATQCPETSDTDSSSTQEMLDSSSFRILNKVPTAEFPNPAEEINFLPNNQELSNDSSISKLCEVRSVRLPSSADEIDLQRNNDDKSPQETAISVQPVISSVSLQSGDKDSNQFEFTEVKMETDSEIVFEPECTVSNESNIWQPSSDNCYTPVFLPPSQGTTVQQNPNTERVLGPQTIHGGLKDAPAVGMDITNPSPACCPGPDLGSRYTSGWSQPLYTDVNREHLSAEIYSLKAAVEKLENISKGLEACRKLEDELDHFGKYLTSLLRGLPERTVQFLQTKIVSEVFAAKGFQVQAVSLNQNNRKRSAGKVQTTQPDYDDWKRRNEKAVGVSTVSQTGLGTSSPSQGKSVQSMSYTATQAKINPNTKSHTQISSFCQTEKISPVGNSQSPSQNPPCIDRNSQTQITSFCQSKRTSAVGNPQSSTEKCSGGNSRKPSDSATEKIKTPKLEDETCSSSLNEDCEFGIDIEPGPGMTQCKSEVGYNDTYSQQEPWDPGSFGYHFLNSSPSFTSRGSSSDLRHSSHAPDLTLSMKRKFTDTNQDSVRKKCTNQSSYFASDLQTNADPSHFEHKKTTSETSIALANCNVSNPP